MLNLTLVVITILPIGTDNLSIGSSISVYHPVLNIVLTVIEFDKLLDLTINKPYFYFILDKFLSTNSTFDARNRSAVILSNILKIHLQYSALKQQK